MTPVLELSTAPDLALRQLQLEDAPELFRLVDNSRSYLSPWLSWVEGTTSVEDSRAFISALTDPGIFAQGLVFTVRHCGELAGTIGFHRGDGLHRRVELGYWLGEPFAGKGLMTRAAERCLAYAFEQGDVNRLEIKCHPDNRRSRALAERLGFRYEGLEREGFRRGNVYLDMLVFSLLRREWTR